ncbi:MAG: EthD domain-containing protein [Acidimicrobiia bacterium]|nr:EthD domain-containing protein [Acidimicrobiia bacterium]
MLVAEPTDALAAEPLGVPSRPATVGGVASWWFEGEPPGGAGHLVERFAADLPCIGGYLLEEVVHWDDGGSFEVVVTLSARRRPDLDRATFRRRYHDGHAPLARVHHPGVARYVQAFVDRPLLPGSPDLDALTELCFRTEDDLRERFFRDEESPTIVWEDVARFLDRRATRTIVTVGHQGSAGSDGIARVDG